MPNENQNITLLLLMLASGVLMLPHSCGRWLGPLTVRLFRKLGFLGANLGPIAFHLPFSDFDVVLDPRQPPTRAAVDRADRCEYAPYPCFPPMRKRKARSAQRRGKRRLTFLHL
jgi:hypothetical protein